MADLNFFDGFESGNSNGWDEHSVGAHSVTVQNQIKKTGDYAVKFFIDNDDWLDGKRRAELLSLSPGFGYLNLRTEYWYEGDYYFPSDFPVETCRTYTMWQLHPGPAISPSIAIMSSEDNVNYTGPGTHTNLRLINRRGSMSSWQTDHYDLGLMSDYLGQWNNIVMHFFLTDQNDGYLEMWINDNKVVDVHDHPTHYDISYGPYFKFGLYAQGGGGGGATPIEIYVDNVTFKEGSFGYPTVSTQNTTDITDTTAVGHGTIVAVGDANCTKRGVCWNITGNPTIANNKAEEVGNFIAGAFSRNITNLTAEEHYYAKAYAYNVTGYGYGNQVEFDTNPSGIHIIDNGDTGTSSTGNWYVSGGENPYGIDSLTCSETDSTYTFEKTLDGKYTVSLWWTYWSSRSDNVTVRIYDNGDNLLATESINQQLDGGQWNELDTYDFNTTAKVVITSTGGSPTASTCADAIKFALDEGITQQFMMMMGM